jgi:hypothetical protein
MWNPANKIRRFVAIAIISVPTLLVLTGSMFGPFWGPLLSRAIRLMPSRVAGNWTEVCFGVGIFIVAQIINLLRLGWPEMQKKWKESIGIGVLSAATGWVGLFFYSLILEIRDIRMTASKIEAPKIHTPRPPRDWDQKSSSPKPLHNGAVPNFKGTIEGVFFLAQTPGNEGCIGVITVISANIRNDGVPSIADIKQIKVVLPVGREIELTTIMSPFEGIAVQRRLGEVPIYLPAKNYLPIKAVEQPIPTGGETYGWLWGCARGLSLSEIDNPASKIILPFTDFKGRPYTARASLSDKQIEVISPPVH